MGHGVALWLATITNVCCGQASSGVVGPGWVTTRVHGANPCPHKRRVPTVVTHPIQPMSHVAKVHKKINIYIDISII